LGMRRLWYPGDGFEYRSEYTKSAARRLAQAVLKSPDPDSLRKQAAAEIGRKSQESVGGVRDFHHALGRPQRLAAWACAGFGILVMVLSTVLSIRKALHGGSHRTA
jgi:hypothetical protein